MLIGSLNEWRKDMSLIGQMFISMFIITTIELLIGLIVNVWMGLGVWDYSHRPYNFMGQICLTTSFLWFLLCIPGFAASNIIKEIIMKLKQL